jgi:hypothetical protein
MATLELPRIHPCMRNALHTADGHKHWPEYPSSTMNIHLEIPNVGEESRTDPVVTNRGLCHVLLSTASHESTWKPRI